MSPILDRRGQANSSSVPTRAAFFTFETLDLGNNNGISAEGAKRIAEALERNTTLQADSGGCVWSGARVDQSREVQTDCFSMRNLYPLRGGSERETGFHFVSVDSLYCAKSTIYFGPSMPAPLQHQLHPVELTLSDVDFHSRRVDFL